MICGTWRGGTSRGFAKKPRHRPLGSGSSTSDADRGTPLCERSERAPRAAAPFAWRDHTAVGELLAQHGYTLSTEARDLVVTADSVDDFWTTRFVHHPLGAAFLPVLEQAGLLDSVRAAAVDLLAGADQDPHGFRVSASYVVHRAVR